MTFLVLMIMGYYNSPVFSILIYSNLEKVGLFLMILFLCRCLNSLFLRLKSNDVKRIDRY